MLSQYPNWMKPESLIARSYRYARSACLATSYTSL